MSKKIMLGEADIKKILEDVEAQLRGMKCYGDLSFKKNLASTKEKCSVYFTSTAWTKIKALVEEFSTEVQWHGLVHRISPTEFEVYDILVPPHEVSAATVTSDQKKYEEWLNALPDEVFNDMLFHGHSHVNMGVTPSGTDDSVRRKFVTGIPVPKNEGEDGFYIFMIFNKRGEWSGEVYDLKQNTLYGTSDIEIDVYDGDDGWLSEFVAEAKKVAVEPKKAPVTAPKTNGWVWDSKLGVYVQDKSKKAKEPETPDTDYSNFYGYYGYGGRWDD